MSDARKRLEGKLAQLAARAEIMRQFADQFADKADPYWQTAEADATGYELEAADLRALLAEGERMRELVKALIDIDGATSGGIKDSTDNDDGAYQSAHLDVLLDTIAREALGDPE